jgi:hypothetical protein
VRVKRMEGLSLGRVLELYVKEKVDKMIFKNC